MERLPAAEKGRGRGQLTSSLSGFGRGWGKTDGRGEECVSVVVVGGGGGGEGGSDFDGYVPLATEAP